MVCDFKALPGQAIYIPGLDCPAIICSVTLMEGGAQYNIRYWMNGEQKFATVSANEFE